MKLENPIQNLKVPGGVITYFDGDTLRCKTDSGQNHFVASIYHDEKTEKQVNRPPFREHVVFSGYKVHAGWGDTPEAQDDGWYDALEWQDDFLDKTGEDDVVIPSRYDLFFQRREVAQLFLAEIVGKLRGGYLQDQIVPIESEDEMGQI